MNEKIEFPVLGSTEAAVRACVNLIALATHTDEDHLAYWLDLYYQTRCRHEGAYLPVKITPLSEIEQGVSVIGEVPCNNGPSLPETPAAAKKKQRAPLTAAERRKLQNAEKEKKRIQGKGNWREFKRATFARLQEARAAGVTVGAIVAASGGGLTENTVLDILDAAPRPIEDYRALDAALEKCAEI